MLREYTHTIVPSLRRMVSNMCHRLTERMLSFRRGIYGLRGSSLEVHRDEREYVIAYSDRQNRKPSEEEEERYSCLSPSLLKWAHNKKSCRLWSMRNGRKQLHCPAGVPCATFTGDHLEEHFACMTHWSIAAIVPT